ncbi:hypothetical protein PG987_008248 [Apiospora arundinis]
MDSTKRGCWLPGVKPTNTFTFDLTAALKDIKANKVHDDTWLYLLKRQCKIGLHIDYENYPPHVSLLKLQLNFVACMDDLIAGWVDPTPRRWCALKGKMASREPNSRDDRLADRKALFSEALKQEDADGLIACLAQGTPTITFTLPDSEARLVDKNPQAKKPTANGEASSQNPKKRKLE